jgi:hypothetical protein
MYAHKYFPAPPAALVSFIHERLAFTSQNVVETRGSEFISRFGAGSLFWLFLMPMLFYLAWQLFYFLVVQVRTCYM